MILHLISTKTLFLFDYNRIKNLEEILIQG